ncbi:thioesterase II family protein [Dickeya dadantii]|uniref:thioesterase II family protein n=1 Tax=Dickeya dadantii TaxID=204038 RepID=UPI000577B602|nr:alpha/beta fold hydrolase [Dickeya dadantii]
MYKMKIFCLPYAGGSASIYRKWQSTIHPLIEWVPLELAGRGSRLNEAPYEIFQDCINEVYDKIIQHGLNMPYALLGHSMGASIAFEVAQKLVRHAQRLPMHLFISGRRAPQSVRPVKKMHLLSEDEFIAELRLLGGTADELFADCDLLALFLPIIRADYRMLATYLFQAPPRPIDVAFTILNGKSDDLFPEEITGWQALSMRKCEYRFFDGGHFFIDQHYKEISHYLNSVMLSTGSAGEK